ncbi:MAG: hypothetical protein GC159_15820 [Phycisphaera sp.]|nr:hypothetical protein [Phycisphaera sp.]
MPRIRTIIVTLALTAATATAAAWAIDVNPGKLLPRPGAGDARIRKELGEDPLRIIGGGMSEVASDLGQYETHDPVQTKQQRIVRQLDVLIRQLEQQQKGGGSGNGSGQGSTNNPTSPLDDSKIVGGPGGIGDLHDPKHGNKGWAELPPHLRDKVLQSKTEGFPPGYEDILRSYYERLAQEKLTDVSPAAPASPDGSSER